MRTRITPNTDTFYAVEVESVDKVKRYSEVALVNFRSSLPEVFCKKGVLWNFAKFTEKRLCWGLQLYWKRGSDTGGFFCAFCEIVKNTFSYRTPPVAASGIRLYLIISIDFYLVLSCFLIWQLRPLLSRSHPWILQYRLNFVFSAWTKYIIFNIRNKNCLSKFKN